MKPAKFSVQPIACFALAAVLIGCAAPSPAVVTTPSRPAPRPTFPFPAGTPVPVTSAEGVLIENEAGPLYVILSTVDEHGLAGEPTLDLMSRPDPAATTSVGSVPSGAFAQVLEIRRLPPDYLRSFYRVKVHDGASRLLQGWVGDWHARRIVFVVEFDERGCACSFPVQLWADAQRTQPAGLIPNRSPLRLLALAEKVVQVQVLSDGTIGWISRDVVHESEENEFLKNLAPRP